MHQFTSIKIFSIILLCCSASSYADISWSWRFTPSTINTSKDQLVRLRIEVSNDLNSEQSIYFGGFDLLDGGWGHPPLIMNGANEVIYTPTIDNLPQFEEIKPGETLRRDSSYLTPSEFLHNGEQIEVNPYLWTTDRDLSNDDSDDALLLMQYAESPLIIHINSITIPMANYCAVLLLTAALICLARRSRVTS